MREYAVVPTKNWITPLAKSLRGNPVAQLIALYLKTGPHANMIGLYHLPLAYIAQDTGVPIEGALKALACLSEAGYCTFDEQADVVFVHDMAPEQVGAELTPKDNRTKAVLREWTAVPSDRLRREFHRLYASAYLLPPMPADCQPVKGAPMPLRSPLEAPSEPLRSPLEAPSEPLRSPLEAPSEPLRSQEQEQEQEQDHEKDHGQESSLPVLPLDGGREVAVKGAKQHSSEYSVEFEDAWTAYPKRPGHSKAEANRCWKARISAGEDPAVMLKGARRYASYCKATGTAPQFVKHAATFYGPDRHYLNDWSAPTRMPANPMHGGRAMTDEQRAAAGDASTAEAARLLGFDVAVNDGEVLNATT